MAKKADNLHRAVKRSHIVVRLSALQHAERFAVGEGAHDVEGVKGKPVGDVNRLAFPFEKLPEQEVRMVGYAGLVVSESYA